jgi:glycosyltransferase involved in cell wall biosynthesis
VLLTEIIAPYRIPVFNALAQHEDIDLQVIFLAETDSTQRQWLVYKQDIRFPYQVLPSWRRRFGKYHVLLNRGLQKALAAAAPDVIVCGGYNYLASWQALWWARRRRVSFALWVESTAKDLRKKFPLVELLKAQFMKKCNAFVVAGKSAAEYVKSFGAADDRIYFAPDAVDTEFFSKRSEALRHRAGSGGPQSNLPPRFFLFVGRLVPEKGVFDLLDAYSALSPELRSRLGLVFVGNGPAAAELERRAAGITPGVIQFPGFAQREVLAHYYALAEAFVFPTHSDPWGLVVNEAMACSLPVICSSAAGCAEDLVTDRWNGRLVPAHDPEKLRQAMEELACDSNLRAEMGRRSRERISQYSPENCATGIANAALGRRSVCQ